MKLFKALLTPEALILKKGYPLILDSPASFSKRKTDNLYHFGSYVVIVRNLCDRYKCVPIQYNYKWLSAHPDILDRISFGSARYINNKEYIDEIAKEHKGEAEVLVYSSDDKIVIYPKDVYKIELLSTSPYAGYFRRQYNMDNRNFIRQAYVDYTKDKSSLYIRYKLPKGKWSKLMSNSKASNYILQLYTSDNIKTPDRSVIKSLQSRGLIRVRNGKPQLTKIGLEVAMELYMLRGNLKF